MKKAFARMFACILAVCILLASCQSEPRTLAEYGNENSKDLQLLTVQNGELVNESGETVVLHGVNLGNWMLMETWMSFVEEYTEDWGYYDTLEVLTERFGAEQTAALVAAYEENFITEADIAQIERLGFNCVRVPFWYRNFMTEDGVWLAQNADDNPGFQRLDWLLETCAAHGIYVILDLHGAPGGQSMNHCTGKAGRNELYESEERMAQTVALWQAIAERYKDNKAVAAYDLLNEPQNNGGYTGEYAWEAESEEATRRTNEAYDTLYHAVREIDPNHVISFEGVWSTTVLPDPESMGYENLLYQLHLYDTERGMVRYRVNELKTAREDWGVAVLVGEYNNGEKESYAQRKYRRNDINRIKWTYKTFNAGEQWGIFNKDAERIDIRTASYEKLLAFCQNEVKTDSFAFNAAEMEIIA